MGVVDDVVMVLDLRNLVKVLTRQHFAIDTFALVTGQRASESESCEPVSLHELWDGLTSLDLRMMRWEHIGGGSNDRAHCSRHFEDCSDVCTGI